MSRGFSRPAYAVFSALFRPWMAHRLAGVHLAGLPASLPAGVPALLVANHCGWWDPFLLWEVARRLRPGAPMHSVMLERELRRRPLLRRLGALGMEPDSAASIGHAVRELSARLEERPDSMVFFFPQGRIVPSYRRPLDFRRGVELFARRLAPVTVLPVALHLEPLGSPAPHAWVSAGRPVPPGEPATAGELERRVEAELDAVLDFVARHGEQAPARWPAGGERLPVPSPQAAAVRWSST